MSPRAHSRLGASNASRWMNCPGSVALCETLPEQKAGAAADLGTAAHAWAEYALRNGEVDLNGYVGAECPDPALAEFPPLTTEMAEAVSVYLDHVWSILKPEDQLHVERRFSLEFIAAEMFGTNDCAVLKPDGTLHVIDYKHGAGVFVTVEDNPQLKYYALGAFEVFRREQKITHVVVTIVQPRAGGDSVRSVEYTAIDIVEFGLELRQAAQRARAPDAPRVPGKWCQFCPGTKGACKEFENRALAVAKDGFGEILPPEKTAALSNDEVGERLKIVYLLEMWCERFKEMARERALAGEMPTGFKFVASRGRRKWASADEIVLADAKLRAGIDLASGTAISVAQAEKKFGKRKVAELADLISHAYSKPTLVLETDKRPALSLSEVNSIAADGFEVIE